MGPLRTVEVSLRGGRQDGHFREIEEHGQVPHMLRKVTGPVLTWRERIGAEKKKVNQRAQLEMLLLRNLNFFQQGIGSY